MSERTSGVSPVIFDDGIDIGVLILKIYTDVNANKDINPGVDTDESSNCVVDDDKPGVLPYRGQPWARLGHSHSSMI